MDTREPAPRELVLGTLAVSGVALLAHAVSSAVDGRLCTVGGCLTADADPLSFWTTIAWLVALTSTVVAGAWLGSRKLGLPLLPARVRRDTAATAATAPPRLRVISGGR